ncbi:MAG: dihydroorotase [Clostridia bacterium]|nr:dihydroorotase [Clostridia bacterium]
MIIKNGTVINPIDQTAVPLEIQIEEGIITAIGTNLKYSDQEKIVDAKGLYVAPGLIDVHVHFREPGFEYKENIETGAAAAARGGFTTVVCMANTKPAVDSKETLQYVIEQGQKTPIHVLSAACVTEGMRGTSITNMAELKEAGAAGFTDDGIPIMDKELLRTAMEMAKKLNLPISLHEEDPSYIQNNGIHAGKVAKQLGIGGSPSIAEESLVKRDLELACETGVSINIQHISSAKAVQLVREAKKRSDAVHAEATPHHFTLTEEAVLKYGTYAKMNPPLRTQQDRQAIIEGLKDGTIDLIATDHAPHSVEEKKRPLTEAPSGIIGLESALAVGITSLCKSGYLTLAELIKKMTLNPADLYHLDAGTIEIGKKADLVLFDPSETWVYETSVSKAENTPFIGQTLQGKVKMTICEGQIIYQDK